ncbi:MAG: hypothetical protein H5T62_01395 [Anaerolineae bacterium]|nr:hypothetical protein [Anaerolineae bacterium]
MSLDIWFREDILHALRAADQASATTAAALEHALGGAEGAGVGDPRYLRAYREGYRAALVTVAMAFGIEPAEEKSLFAAAGSVTSGSAGEALPGPQSSDLVQPCRVEVRQRFFA